jgi:hypothetical protein
MVLGMDGHNGRSSSSRGQRTGDTFLLTDMNVLGSHLFPVPL